MPELSARSKTAAENSNGKGIARVLERWVTEVGADPVREPSRLTDANEAMHSAQASGDTSRPIPARPHSQRYGLRVRGQGPLLHWSPLARGGTGRLTPPVNRY